MSAVAVSPLLPLLLADLTSGPDELRWMDFALCAETDPDAFFVEKGGNTGPAKAVCRRCDVRAECLEYALVHSAANDVGFWGIWGGTSPNERQAMLRRRVEERRAA